MLHIGVHDNYRIARGIIESRHHGDLLTVVAREIQVAEPRVGRVQLAGYAQGIVGASVVHDKEFPVVGRILPCDLKHALAHMLHR